MPDEITELLEKMESIIKEKMERKTVRHVDRNAFSPMEIAERNSIGRTTVYEEIKAGRLVARKIGNGKGRTIIMLEDERDWLAALPRMKTEVG